MIKIILLVETLKQDYFNAFLRNNNEKLLKNENLQDPRRKKQTLSDTERNPKSEHRFIFSSLTSMSEATAARNILLRQHEEETF